MEKTCTRCNMTKPITEFGVSRQGAKGPVYRTRCRQCQSTKSQQWYWENVDRAATNRRRSGLAKYGLTLEQYEQMLVKQGGVCAICGTDKNSGGHMLVVDHDHETEKVRGLLCHKCNRAIGLLGDNIDLLKRAAEYLERNSD